MKFITKAGAPRDYLDWCRANKGLPNEDYRRLQNPEKSSLHECLLREQGWICAYTMRRITADLSHIEHIKPETLCRADVRGSDLDYNNLVACYPKEGMREPFRYGAQAKGSWWQDEGRNFISPLQAQCEAKFAFNLKGEISAVGNDVQAQITISVLKLDHRSLTEDRKRAIDEFIFGPNGDAPLSPKRAGQAVETMAQRNGAGQFQQYCMAIRQALMEHIRRQQTIHQRRRYIKAQQNQK